MLDGWRKGLIWYGLLHKRLLKRVSFLLILLLIPLLAGLVSLSAREESSFLRIAVSAEDTSQPVYAAILARLQDDSQIVAVTAYANAAQAQAAVEAADADAAWIFEEGLEQRLDRVAAGHRDRLVRVVTPAFSTLESTAREKLFGALFPEISYRIYAAYTADTLDGLAVPEEELRVLYEEAFRDESVLQYAFLDSADNVLENARVVTAPLRGLLAVVMVFCGMAATMFFIRDEREGVFSVLTGLRRVLVLLGNNLAALTLAAVFVTAALLLSGQYTAVGRETVAMLGLVLMTAGFCALLGTLCRGNALMGALLPVVLIACVAFCPVLYNVRTFLGPQALLPPFYYLYGVNDLTYLLPMGAYCMVTYGLTAVLYRLTRRAG